MERRTLYNAVGLIKQETAAQFGVSVRDIDSRRTDRTRTTARYAAILLAHEFTGLSLPRLARHFGNRDHTTILYALRSAQDRYDAGQPDNGNELSFRESVDQLRERLTPLLSAIAFDDRLASVEAAGIAELEAELIGAIRDIMSGLLAQSKERAPEMLRELARLRARMDGNPDPDDLPILSWIEAERAAERNRTVPSKDGITHNCETVL